MLTFMPWFRPRKPKVFGRSEAEIIEVRLTNELISMQEIPEFPLITGPIAEDIFEWKATIVGPVDSPFAGGRFLLTLNFASGYPFEPPQVTFMTKVFHPNIDSEGSISLGVLELNDWLPTITVTEVLLCIYSLLEEPDPDDALVPEIADMFKNDRSEYEKIARSWTQNYAYELAC